MGDVATPCVGCQHVVSEQALYCPNCGRPKLRDLESDSLLGRLLGDRFQIQAAIGQGGSGTVYRAEHVTLRRKVAVKVLHKELSRDELVVEKFRREATTVTAIDNEHIVKIFDFGRTRDGRLYLVMELLEGETLDALLARVHVLPFAQIADILIQVGRALMEAHAIGYVHRDIRPRNLYLALHHGQPNFVKLLDFGLAKLVEADAYASSSRLGMTFGDPRYMAPEQARGDRVDRRSDLYQLGCVAYEMATGAPPFTGDRVLEVLTKHVIECPEPVPTRRSGVPLWLEAACAKLLAKDPNDRFATATRMVEALQRGLDTGEVMDNDDARHCESVLPASVSRVMQRMGVTQPYASSPADSTGEPVSASPSLISHTEPNFVRHGVAMPELGSPVAEWPSKVAVPSADDGARSAERSSATDLPLSEESARWYAEGERASAEAEQALRDHPNAEWRRRSRSERALWTISPGNSDVSQWDMPKRRGPAMVVTLLAMVATVGGIAFAFTRVGGSTPTSRSQQTAVSISQIMTNAVKNRAERSDGPSGAATAVAPISNSASRVATSPAPSASPAAAPATSPAAAPATSTAPATSPPPAPATSPPPAPATSPAPVPASSRPVTNSRPQLVRRQAVAAPRLRIPPVAPASPPSSSSDAVQGPADPYATAAPSVGESLQDRQAAIFADLGQSALRRGNFREAIAHLQRAASLTPSTRLFTLLGEAYLESAQFASAAENFKRALQLNPDNDRARAGYDAASARIPPPTDDEPQPE